MFKTGDKVYSESMKKNLVVSHSKNIDFTVCIDISEKSMTKLSFDTFTLYTVDLKLGWRYK